MKYLKYFPTEAEYNAFIQSEDFILPNVSYAVDADSVFYNIVKTESGDYKIFLLEKKDISGLETTYEMVDLGLPSGLLWADKNIGALAPEDFGTYFAWGETEGYNASIKYCTAEELCAYLTPLVGEELTPDNIDDILADIGIEGTDTTAVGIGFVTDKCFSSDFSDYFDTTDGGETFNKYNNDGGLTELDGWNDAAVVNSIQFRMPTNSEFQELIDNTTITFIDRDNNEFSQSETKSGSISERNLKGIKFTGSNGNSIFIPASGYGVNFIINIFCYGYLWSSSLDSSDASSVYCLGFGFNGFINGGSSTRCFGMPVRGVTYNNPA